MPRYVVHPLIERTYVWNPACAQASDHSEDGSIPSPNPLRADWMVEFGEQSSRTVTRDGEEVTQTVASMSALRPMAIIARNEAEATEHALKCSVAWRDDVPSMRDGNGWYASDQQVTVQSIRREAATPRHRKSFEVDYATLVSPDMGAHHLETDQMFELMRWMIRTSRNYESPARYVPWSVHRLLRGNDSNWEETVLSVGSREDLHARLVRGVLGVGHDIYKMWREDHGIAYGAKQAIEAAHYGPAVGTLSTGHFGRSLSDAMWGAMREVPGLLLSESPNPAHKTATCVKNLRVVIDDDGFAFRLRYGFEDDWSSWSYDLARTRGSEPFYDTAERAMTLLGEMVPGYRSTHGMREAV